MKIQQIVLLPALAVILIASPEAASAPSTPPPDQPHPHQDVSCRQCHLMGAGTAVDLDRARQARCAGCHAAVPAALADSLGFHRAGARNCLDCHSFHDSNVTRGRAAGIRIDAVKSTGAGHCRGCHDPRGNLLELSEGHRAAADLYHSDSQSLQALSPSESCLNCHADALTSRWGKGWAQGSPASANTPATPWAWRSCPAAGPEPRTSVRISTPGCLCSAAGWNANPVTFFQPGRRICSSPSPPSSICAWAATRPRVRRPPDRRLWRPS